MSKVDDHVRRVILTYPHSMQNRFDVLHHIFCVLGNGYEWVDGAPVDEDADYTPWQPADEAKGWSKLQLDFLDVEEITKRRVQEVQDRLATLDGRVQDMSLENSGRGYTEVYRQSEYAMLMTLPADLDPEWAAAAEQIKQIVATKGWVF